MTPTPPGVAETLLEIELEAVTVAIVVEADRDAVGAEKDGNDGKARRVAAELGQDQAGEYPARRVQDGSAGDQLLAKFRQSLPEDARQQDEKDDCAGGDQEDERSVIGDEAELDRERAADREEEVEVEGDVENGEGDLLDDQSRDHKREGGAGNQRREHHQHHEGADVGGQEAVERDRRGVGGED